MRDEHIRETSKYGEEQIQETETSKIQEIDKKI